MFIPPRCAWPIAPGLPKPTAFCEVQKLWTALLPYQHESPEVARELLRVAHVYMPMYCSQVLAIRKLKRLVKED